MSKKKSATSKGKRSLVEEVTQLGEQQQEAKVKAAEQVSVEGKGTEQILTLRSKTIRTLEDALESGHVDLRVWEVERWVLNKWDSGAKLTISVDGIPMETLAATELWQVKVWLKRKHAVNIAIIDILDELKKASPLIPKLSNPSFQESSKRRALELCIMDPHLGMHCFAPGADHAWSLEDCESVYMWALNGLLERSKTYGPFEEIVIPFGNDFMHVDNREGTTTAGTNQPEALPHDYVFSRAVKLMIQSFDRILEFCKDIGPVRILPKVIRGNHDEFSTCALGHVLWAYYHNNQNVEVDCSDSPYKFYRYGTNLIGYDHGHSVAPIRMAAIMANEVPQWWAETSYREWHCGDQHRKGSSKPVTFEEQGVSVEYLQALTPPNQWHRKKSFNWQKRGAVSYVWDHDTGPIARLQVNMNSYTGRPTGEKRK